MEPFTLYQNNLVNKNRKIFSEFTGIKWLGPYQAMEALEKRDKLTEKTEGDWMFKGTKPFYNQISKGCELCGEGTWSCLFITNKCNARCFYCPSSQLKDEVPATQSLNFKTAEGYADYINFFGFKGASFSGGEPLLFFDRTLHYLKTIRKMCSPELYIWMYTNGILADKQKFQQLADAGLNEIRFDIGATGYRLDKVQLAKGIIPHITVEIPVVPEKKEKLKQMLPEMIKAGVTNLNLHQLRLTRYNAPKLLQHSYTFIPAEQPVVLESELAALEIQDYARKNKLDIGINYCSFFFKNRFQQAGFRKRLAKALTPSDAVITEKGFLRKYNQNSIGYKTVTLHEDKVAGSEELHLEHKTCYFKTESAMNNVKLNDETKAATDELLKTEPGSIPADDLLFRIWQMEYIEKGLREY
ncbi:MAG: radical SAM protein [Bacteroidota bacterium]